MRPVRLLGAWLLAALLLAALLPGLAAAHPYSTTRAELDYQAEKHRFEVALMVLPEDLVQMIEAARPRAPEGAAAAERFRLDDSAACDAEIAGYLEKHVVLTLADGTRARLEWVGKELAFDATWLYFELVLPRKEQHADLLEKATLRVDLGFELSHEHLNAVRLRWNGHSQGLLFSRLEPAMTLRGASAAASGSAP